MQNNILFVKKMPSRICTKPFYLHMFLQRLGDNVFLYVYQKVIVVTKRFEISI